MEYTSSASTETPPANAPGEPAVRAGGAVSDPRDRTIGAVCAVLLVVGMAVGYFSGDTSTGEIIGFFVLTGVWLIAIALLATRLVPRWRAAGVERATRTALILGVLAFVTCGVFWTGLPFALGAGAIMLGLWAREAAPADARGKATVALGLGGFAVLASFVVLLVGS
jgi:hypothetical protein